MVAAQNLVASVLLVSGTSHAFSFKGMGNFDMSTLMKLSAMQRQFKTDQIEGEQSVALMEYAGFNDMELFMSKQISADEFKTSMKQQMKDKLIQNVLQNGGLDINNPFFRKSFFGDIDDAESFTMGMLEPMQSIIRLMRYSEGTTVADTTKVRDYGKHLLKKLQYEQFNTNNGNFLTDNMDEIMLATGDKRKAVIKDILEQSLYQNIQDPIDRAMMHYLTAQKRDPTNASKYKTQIKDLQTIKIFQSSVPATSPVTDDNLYAFYRMVNGQVKPADVLNIALGEDLGPISELDFERYFGSPAKQFSCRAHTDTIRVPCGVQLKPDECVAAGCCYKDENNDAIPSCFHDLYGKIGSGMLRRAWFKDEAISKQISGLFVDQTVPTIDKILREAMPESLYGVAYNKYDPVNDKYSKGGLGLNAVAMDANSQDWWSAAHVNTFEKGPNEDQTAPGNEPKRTGDGGARLWNQRQPARRYGRKDYQWTPHGPTQSPFFNNMPGVNPTANPLDNGMGSLDDYYQIWLSYANTQDQAQCALIPENNRVKCMENYEALVDHKINAYKATSCYKAGCCFNEDSFLAGKPACYRATDYGKCRNLPPNYQKTECGYEGIGEAECLNNAQCCYEPSADRKDPWCFKKYSATLDESQWCLAWSEEQYRNVPRTPCFAVKSGKSNMFNDNEAHNINNLVSQEQCEANGDCCYDASLSADYLDWLTEGLGYKKDTMFRCFKKRNPLVVAQEKGTVDFGQSNPDSVDGSMENEALDLSKFGDGTKDKFNPHEYEPRIKTCDNTKWEIFGGKIGFKRSCGDNLTYYQCVYQKRCCYKATVSNEPVCYYPEFKAGTGYNKIKVTAAEDGTVGRN